MCTVQHVYCIYISLYRVVSVFFRMQRIMVFSDSILVSSTVNKGTKNWLISPNFKHLYVFRQLQATRCLYNRVVYTEMCKFSRNSLKKN